jgi:plasmid replication initiation protein
LYSVHAKDLAELSGISLVQAYKELKTAALKLKRREVSIYEKPNGAGKHASVMIANWVQTIRYVEGAGKVDLRFNYDMIPYINQLTTEFTEFFMHSLEHNAFKMNSTYGYRLYELLMQWKSTGRREIEIDWLRGLFDLTNNYKLMADFKKRVIEPAVDDINMHTPYWVQYTQQKTGRKITHFVFSFGLKDKDKPKKIKKKPTKADLKDPKFLSKHGLVGENTPDVIRRLKEQFNI